jgi:hypothetical protein
MSEVGGDDVEFIALRTHDARWANCWKQLEPLDRRQVWYCKPYIICQRSSHYLDRLWPGRQRVTSYLPGFDFWGGGADGVAGPPSGGSASSSSAPALPIPVAVAAGGVAAEGEGDYEGDSDRFGLPVDLDAVDEELKALGDLLEAGEDGGAQAEAIQEELRKASVRARVSFRRGVRPSDRPAPPQPSVPPVVPAGGVPPPPPPLPPPAAVAAKAKAKGRLRRPRVEDPYPRLYHPSHPDSYVRLVETEHNKDVKAFCGFHPGCTMTRVLHKGRKRGQGKPMGLLWSFLGTAARTDTKAEHQTLHMPTRDERFQARVDLEAIPGARPWLNAEDPDVCEGEPLDID